MKSYGYLRLVAAPILVFFAADYLLRISLPDLVVSSSAPLSDLSAEGASARNFPPDHPAANIPQLIPGLILRANRLHLAWQLGAASNPSGPNALSFSPVSGTALPADRDRSNPRR